MIPATYVDETCKLGQGEACCAFLVMGVNGFDCAKGRGSGVELTIRARLKRGTMGAKGDNCDGWSPSEDTQ